MTTEQAHKIIMEYPSDTLRLRTRLRDARKFLGFATDPRSSGRIARVYHLFTSPASSHFVNIARLRKILPRFYRDLALCTIERRVAEFPNDPAQWCWTGSPGTDGSGLRVVLLPKGTSPDGQPPKNSSEKITTPIVAPV